MKEDLVRYERHRLELQLKRIENKKRIAQVRKEPAIKRAWERYYRRLDEIERRKY